MAKSYSFQITVDNTTVLNSALFNAIQQQYLNGAGIKEVDEIPTTAPSPGENICAYLDTIYFWNGTAWIGLVNQIQDYSLVPDSEIAKLETIEEGAEKNVNADWSSSEGDSEILNKPTLGTASSKDTGTSEGNVPILGNDGKLSNSVMPPLSISQYVGSIDTQAELVTLSTAEQGDWAYVTTDPTTSKNGAWMLNGTYSVLSDWLQLSGPGTVYSVNGYTGVVVITKADLGLGDTENGAQVNALASLPTPSALNLNKVYQFIGTTGTYVQYTFYRCILSGETYSWSPCNPTSEGVNWGGIGGTLENQTDLQAALTGKAPTSHASSATTYGVSSATDYGHAKASSTTPIMDGIATVGTEASSFARGDHVHPTKVVSASNIGISTWVANTDNATIYAEGYIYMANVTVTGMLSTMYPKIELDDNAYISGNVWNRYESFNGFIRIYSKTNTTITVLTAIGEVIA